MKFTLNRSTALHVMKQALKTCNTKAKGQPDSEFLFQPIDGVLYLTSLNETAEQNLIVPCDNIEFFPNEAFSVAGAALVEFLSQFPEEDINCVFRDDEKVFAIGNKKTQYVFPTGEETDFVPFNYQTQGASVDVDALSLRNALKATSFAASTDHTQAPLTAVRLKISEETMIAEACDYLRISSYSTSISDVGADVIELLLPKETSDILASMLEDAATVTIRPGQRHVRFEWGDTTFTSVLENAIGKPYPDVSKWLKGKEEGRLKISRIDLQRSLKLAGLIAKDSYVVVSLVPLNKDGTGGGLKISTNEQDRGMSKDVLVVQEQEGEGEVNVAWRYLSKALDQTVEPWIDVSFRELRTDAVGLVIVDGSFEHLIFPVAPNQVEDDVSTEEEVEE